MKSFQKWAIWKHSAPWQFFHSLSLWASVDQSNTSPPAKWKTWASINCGEVPWFLLTQLGLFCDTLPPDSSSAKVYQGTKHSQINYSEKLHEPLGDHLMHHSALRPNGSSGRLVLENLAGKRTRASCSGSHLLSLLKYFHCRQHQKSLWIPEFLKHVTSILFLSCFMPSLLSFSPYRVHTITG